MRSALKTHRTTTRLLYLAGSLNGQFGFLSPCSKCALVVRPSLWGRTGLPQSEQRKSNRIVRFLSGSSRRRKACSTETSLLSSIQVTARGIRPFPSYCSFTLWVRRIGGNPTKILSQILFPLWLAVLFWNASLLVLALAVEPNRPQPDVLARLVLDGFLVELS